MPKNVFSFTDTPPRVAYLDPSFLINFLVVDALYHKDCVDYSKILEQTSISLVLSNLGFDEIWFALLKILTIGYLNDIGENNPMKKWYRFLKENPQKVKDFSNEIEVDTLLIRTIPNVLIIEISEEQTMMALSYMKKYGLMPRDAIHTAATILSGANTIITTDADFSVVAEIDIHTCNPNCFS